MSNRHYSRSVGFVVIPHIDEEIHSACTQIVISRCEVELVGQHCAGIVLGQQCRLALGILRLFLHLFSHYLLKGISFYHLRGGTTTGGREAMYIDNRYDKSVHDKSAYTNMRIETKCLWSLLTSCNMIICRVRLLLSLHTQQGSKTAHAAAANRTKDHVSACQLLR